MYILRVMHSDGSTAKCSTKKVCIEICMHENQRIEKTGMEITTEFQIPVDDPKP